MGFLGKGMHFAVCDIFCVRCHACASVNLTDLWEGPSWAYDNDDFEGEGLYLGALKSSSHSPTSQTPIQSIIAPWNPVTVASTGQRGHTWIISRYSSPLGFLSLSLCLSSASAFVFFVLPLLCVMMNVLTLVSGGLFTLSKNPWSSRGGQQNCMPWCNIGQHKANMSHDISQNTAGFLCYLLNGYRMGCVCWRKTLIVPIYIWIHALKF